MPKLWEDTIIQHKATIRDAILDAAEAVIVRDGPISLTMSRLAADAGIGRATLYKYFSDIHRVLGAWHARQIDRHLTDLRIVAQAEGDPVLRLRSLLTEFARVSDRSSRHADPHGLHVGSKVKAAEGEVLKMLVAIMADGQKEGSFRRDFPAADLARFCIGVGLAAADSELSSKGPLVELAMVSVISHRPPG